VAETHHTRGMYRETALEKKRRKEAARRAAELSRRGKGKTAKGHGKAPKVAKKKETRKHR